jgi:general secretion pathway protein G
VTSDKRKDNSRGFSLLEMMTVISLIMILATLAMPMYHTVVVRAREVTLRDDLFTLRSQIDRFTHDYERGPTSLDELVEKEYMGAVPTDPFTGSNQTWQVGTTPAPPEPGGEFQDASISIDDSAPLGVVDVHSTSEDNSLEGPPYSSW